MDYKQLIKNMVDEITNEVFLKKIYSFVKVFIEK
jgi:hypothetical protein